MRCSVTRMLISDAGQSLSLIHICVKTSEDAKHVYTGQVAYDNVYGNLSEFTEKVGENRQEFGTKFGYDDANRPTSLTYSIGATTTGPVSYTHLHL